MLRSFRMALIKSLRCLVTFIKRNMAARNEDSILPGVKHVILVLSGKGGVGKSTVATMLAMTLKLSGKKIGILDVDLCGPSIPRMLNVEGNDVHKCPQGWVPVYADKEKTLAVMSIAFLLTSRENAVIWRGPKKNAMIKQFLTDVYWGDIDYLIIDTPPGTSDEHLAVMEALHSFHPDGAVLVTTPQAVAVNDVRREITFCEKTGIPVLGVIENLSGFICPHCKECSNLFSKGGGESLANITKIPFLGCVPIDVKLAQCLEDGHSFIEKYPTSSAAEAFQSIVKILLTTTDK